MLTPTRGARNTTDEAAARPETRLLVTHGFLARSLPCVAAPGEVAGVLPPW